MAIRYDKNINQIINKTIRNFNSKIRRLEKLDSNLILPDTITKKALKDSVHSRQELKRRLKELQRYSSRGIEKTITTKGGVKMSKYELINLRKESARLKRNLSREITRFKTTNPTIFGKITDATFAQMGDEGFLNAIATRKALDKDINKLSKSEFERYSKLVSSRNRSKEYMNTIFKGNYITMLTEVAYKFGYPKDKLMDLERRLQKMDKNQFLKLFNTDRSIQQILFAYDTVIDPLSGIDPAYVQDDTVALYDALIDNIDEILEPYE